MSSRQRKDGAAGGGGGSGGGGGGGGGVAGGGLLPGGGAAGKARRTPARRALRLLRTRPVTSLVVVVCVCALVLSAMAAARAMHGLVARGSPAQPAAAAADAIPAGLPDLRPANDAPPMDAAAAARDAAAALAPAADDPRGDPALPVDGAELADDPAQPADPQNDARPPEPRDPVNVGHDRPLQEVQDKPTAPRSVVHEDKSSGCHRRFEAGFLGSNSSVCVTDEFFFDIAVDTQAVGRIVIGVFGELMPKCVANFRALATCTGEFSDLNLCYRGDSFHRVVPDFVIQGGSKATGRSIYGPTFREEMSFDHHSFLSHIEKGVVSSAEYPIGSQFFILTGRKSAYLDKNHPIFGFVTEGMDVLEKLAVVPVKGDKPLQTITIMNCGDLHGPVSA